MSVVKSKRLRFTFDDDVVLLREIVAQNPIANPEKWNVVQQNVERIVCKKFVKRTLKQHLQLLLEVWMKKEAICKIRSGNEEPYSEKDILLQEISMLCHEAEIQNKNKGSKVSKEKVIAELGREARENIAVSFAYSGEDENIEFNDVMVTDHDYGEMESWNVQSSETLEQKSSEDNIQESSEIVEISETINTKQKEDKPSTAQKRHIFEPNRRRTNKNRTLKKDALAYLNDKHDKENKIRLKELEIEEKRLSIREREVIIEERKLKLMEEKHELDILETKQKIELEKERFKWKLTEKKTTNILLESQQKIIDNLLNNSHSINLNH